VKLRNTFLLIVVFLLLCAAYAFMNFRERQEIRQTEAAKKLFEFAPAAVAELRVEAPGAVTAAAQRDEGGPWRITEPDPTIVPFEPLWNRLADTLAALRNERTIAADNYDPAAWGLEAPALRVAFRLHNGTAEQAVCFGDLEPTAIHRYARRDDGPVILINNTAFRELNRKLGELRDKFVVDDREAPINHIEYVRYWTPREDGPRPGDPEPGAASAAVVLHRDKEDAPWRIRAPIQAPASQDLAEALAMHLQFAAGTGYIDQPEALADYGLDPPRMGLRFRDSHGGEMQELIIGDVVRRGEEEFVYAKRRSRAAVFMMDSFVLEKLPEKPDAFRERHLLTRPVSGVRRVACRMKSGGFVLVRENQNAWRLEAPVSAAADTLMVSRYLATLKAIEGALFPEGGPADYGLNDPDLEITLTFEEEEEQAVIALTPDRVNDAYYAALQDTGAITMAHAGVAALLFEDWRNFLPREMIRFPEKNLKTLSFRFEDTSCRFRNVHGRWVLETPENLRLANQSDMQILLEAINPLRAEAIAAYGDIQPEAYGLGDPVLSLELTLDPPSSAGNTPQQLRVGDPAGPDSPLRFAAVTGRPAVYRISHELIASIRELIRGLETR
jgi:hypothetical protein